MRSNWKLALLCVSFGMFGCRTQTDAPSAPPMPPNTIQLSEMMRELAAQPGFTESVIAGIDKNGKKGPALLTPKLVDELRKRLLGKDWQGLDRFPGWTMHTISPVVHIAGETVGESAAAK